LGISANPGFEQPGPDVFIFGETHRPKTWRSFLISYRLAQFLSFFHWMFFHLFFDLVFDCVTVQTIYTEVLLPMYVGLGEESFR